MKKNTLLTLVFATSTLLWSCTNNEAHDVVQDSDPVENAEDKNEDKFAGQKESDAERILELYNESMFEVELSKVAQTTAKNAEVKSMAKMMAESHGKMNEDLKVLAGSKGIVLPTALSEDQNEKLADIKDNDNFDEDYLDKIIAKHKDAINKAEQLADNSEDAEIKSFFSKAVPELKSHLDAAEKLEDKVDGQD